MSRRILPITVISDAIGYHPLFCFNQHDDCEGAILRPGNVHSADRWKELLEPIVRRHENKKVRKYFRGDAAFAKPEIYEYLEKKSLLYSILFRQMMSYMMRLNIC